MPRDHDALVAAGWNERAEVWHVTGVLVIHYHDPLTGAWFSEGGGEDSEGEGREEAGGDMTKRWEDLSAETRRTIEGVYAPTQDERNGAHPRRCEMALNEFAPEVSVQLQAYARALVKDAAAPYEVPMRMARSRTKPSSPAFRALSDAFKSFPDWIQAWKEGPYQTIGADGTMLKDGKPVGAMLSLQVDAVHAPPSAAKLGVAGKYPALRDGVFLGTVNHYGETADIYWRDGELVYSQGEHQTFAYDAHDQKEFRDAPLDHAPWCSAAIALLDQHRLSSRPNADALLDQGHPPKRYTGA